MNIVAGRVRSVARKVLRRTGLVSKPRLQVFRQSQGANLDWAMQWVNDGGLNKCGSQELENARHDFADSVVKLHGQMRETSFRHEMRTMDASDVASSVSSPSGAQKLLAHAVATL